MAVKRFKEYRVSIWNQKTTKYRTLPNKLRSPESCYCLIADHKKTVGVYHPEYDYSRIRIEVRDILCSAWGVYVDVD